MTASYPMSARGSCECGCGQPTPVATKSDARYGRVRGAPNRFLVGHNRRGCRPRTVTTPCDGQFDGPCVACKAPMHPARSGACADGHYSHAGRGACTSCYGTFYAEGRLFELPRRTFSADELLDEWQHMRGTVPFDLFHERLGMSQEAWRRAYYRAQAAGDERAVRGADDQRWSA